MAAFSIDCEASPAGCRRLARCWLCLAVCVALLVSLPGCGGCRRTAKPQTPEEFEKELAERREKARKKKKKPNFEVSPLVSLPHEPKAKSCWYKPGHWTSTTLAAKANNFNVLGDLELTVLDSDGVAVGMVGMPFTLATSRPVALPKGQPKTFESVLLVPPTGQPAHVKCRINARKGGRGMHEIRHSLAHMPSYQYHFVVLARWPGSYSYLKGLDAITMPPDLGFASPEQNHYRVGLLEAGRRTTLPSHALCWTSIAYILWDDAEPDGLRLEQKLALLDWLHWGGQLILSGPQTLDTLRNSFLADYLPATSAGTRELTAADFEELNARWTLPVHGRPGRRLLPVKPWAGVKLEKAPEARYVPGTGELLVERRVGRGRIVASAFTLYGKELTDWPGFDGFFNACVLGRGSRVFVENDMGSGVTWAARRNRADAGRVSNLRYFTRDTGRRSPAPQYRGDMPWGPDPFGLEAAPILGSDVASWDDFNKVANSAREALQTAARIEIPNRMFVVWVVAGYLLVLVPANWAIFRLLGRVEWAWVAAPVIALVCTLVVIRLARLDIGFARSQVEIDVVELQAGYPRAHVTRYAALYTSLSTRYQFQSEDPGALVQPLPSVANAGNFHLLPGEGRTQLHYRYGKQVSLEGLRVKSNSTELVHAEQMVDLGGAILLRETPGGRFQVVNRTGLALQGAGVIRKTASGNLQTAWIGTLEPEASADLQFTLQPPPKGGGRLWADRRNRWALSAAGASPGDLTLDRLLDLADDCRELRPNDVRLVAWLDQQIPGLEIRPAAPQARHAALVVAHLRYADWKDPQPDQNTRAERQRDPVRTVPL